MSSLEWVWDRIAPLGQADVDEIESQLKDLRAAADDEDTDAAEAAPRLVETVAGLQLTRLTDPRQCPGTGTGALANCVWGLPQRVVPCPVAGRLPSRSSVPAVVPVVSPVVVPVVVPVRTRPRPWPSSSGTRRR